MSDRPSDENDLNLSPTVDKAIDSLADQGPIPAWSLAAAILTDPSDYSNRDVDEVLTRGRERIDPDAKTAMGAHTPEKESTSKMASQETPLDAESKAAAPESPRESITSKPVTEWLLEVQQMYRNTSQPPYLHGRRVLLGLAIADETVRDILKHEGFLDSLLDETNDFAAAVSVDEWWNILDVDRPIQRETTPLLADRPIDDPEYDLLNRQAFAAYLANLIDEVATNGDLQYGAYAIHLSGDWGVGKTSILHFLQDELEGSRSTQPSGSDTEHEQSVTTDAKWRVILQKAWKRMRSMWPYGAATGREQANGAIDAQWTVIRFNAWQNQRINPPWWALVDEVYQKSRPKLRPTVIVRELLWRWSRPRLGTVAAVFTFVLLVTGLIVVLLGFFANIDLSSQEIGGIIALLTLMWPVSVAVSKLVVLRSPQGTASYIKYASNPMSTIKTRFEHLIERIDDDHVVIFIDDIDRCDSDYLVGLLEGIQTLFRGAPVVFVVAGDRDWINTSFEEVYESQAQNHTAAGRSLGTRFLEKTFQFTAPVPQISETMQTTFVESVTDIEADTDQSAEAADAGDQEQPTGEAESTAQPETTGKDNQLSEDALRYLEKIEAAEDEATILKVLEQTTDLSIAEQRVVRKFAVRKFGTLEVRRETEYILLKFTDLLEPNPRGIKRLVNTYGINRVLATLAHADVSQNQLALWTVLSMRWPDLAATLAADPTLLSDDPAETADDRTDEPTEAARLLDRPDVRKVIDWEPDPLKPATVRECARIWG